MLVQVRRRGVDHPVADAQGLLDRLLRDVGRRLEDPEAEGGQFDSVVEGELRHRFEQSHDPFGATGSTSQRSRSIVSRNDAPCARSRNEPSDGVAMANEHPNAAAYRRTADAFRARDWDTVRSLVDDDVVWHVPGSHPLAGEIRGTEAVLGSWSK